MKKISFSLLGLLLLSILIFRFVVPTWVAWDKNRVVLFPPHITSIESQNLYQSLIIADLHADTLLWGRNILNRSGFGHIDVPRLADANVALQVFSVVTKTPKGLNIKSNNDKSDNITLLAIAQGWPWKSLGSLNERALYQAQQLKVFADESAGQLTIIKSREDLENHLNLRKKIIRLSQAYFL